MDASSHVVHPSFLERLLYLFERLIRMQQVGANATYGMENSMPIVGRPMTEAETIESELIRLDSAVRHLSWGETTSNWSNDRYLDRLMKATPELRIRALEERGFTEADYERWQELYAETPAVH